MSARRKSLRHQLHPADLAAWRNRQHISLAAIAAQTKISPHYLEAIECGRFQSLPGGAYNINYLRQYAQAIHFDPERLVDYYRRVSAPAAPIAARPSGRIHRLRNWLRSFVTAPSQVARSR